MFHHAAVVQEAAAVLRNDWFKAAVVVGGGPLSLLFVLLVYGNWHCVRPLGLCGMRPHEPRKELMEEAEDHVAPAIGKISRSWHWSRIFMRAIYLGLFFVMVQVGG
jgi:hypothetical protein